MSVSFNYLLFRNYLLIIRLKKGRTKKTVIGSPPVMHDGSFMATKSLQFALSVVRSLRIR